MRDVGVFERMLYVGVVGWMLQVGVFELIRVVGVVK